MTSASYEWVTKFVIRHHAGSPEGAIWQRNEMDRALREHGGEVVMACTRHGDAAEVGFETFMADGPDEDSV